HGQLSDMGGIYTLGVSPGTVIRNNVFHDVLSNPRVSGGWGIYFDEGSTDILAENNLVYNTLTGTLHQHYGRENRVQNNIFAYSHRGQLIRSRQEDHISFFFERNIVYFNNGLLLGSNWGNDNFKLDHNCYWDSSGERVDFAGQSFEEWQARGHDVHSIVADPGFADPEHGDFRLAADSPALQVGFKPFDTSTAGLYGDPAWVARPRAIAREPFSPPQPPEPVTVSDGFEATPPGTLAAGAATLGEEGDAQIRVTDAIAATGKHSLKITDAPGLQYSYNPHLVYGPHLRKGTVAGAFALRLEPGAIMYHEWRDSRNPYRVGPSIWFDGAGNLSASGKGLLQVPLGEWVRIEIECALGVEADGTYTLRVTLPGQEPRVFEGLACGNPQFSRLDWWGFVANGTESAIFYLDDVDIHTRTATE
ncbi:MAG: right-handed parallel beta-helix repeat-containing protein, partial [Candidatus Hydrogenedentes bacterium]|nr:right-handed parallel beta-helix repeat-containing protein [Candidatus Hydrogenedentota bacterium]